MAKHNKTASDENHTLEVNEGYTYAEVAEALGMTIGEVRTVEANALRKLRRNRKAYELFVAYVKLSGSVNTELIDET